MFRLNHLAGFGAGGVSIAYDAFDPATVTAVTLSSLDHTATNTGTTSASQGARLLTGKSAGSYAIEFSIDNAPSGGNMGFGIGNTTETYANFGNNSVKANTVYCSSGNIWTAGSSSGKSFGSGVLVSVTRWMMVGNLTNLRTWFRRVSGTPNDWNHDATADPATNTGGIILGGGAGNPPYAPFVVFGGSGGTSGRILTVYTDPSSFVGVVPSGITPGWAP